MHKKITTILLSSVLVAGCLDVGVDESDTYLLRPTPEGDVLELIDETMTEPLLETQACAATGMPASCEPPEQHALISTQSSCCGSCPGGSCWYVSAPYGCCAPMFQRTKVEYCSRGYYTGCAKCKLGGGC